MTEIGELLERFRRAPEVIAVMLTGVFGEETDFCPEPGKWSIRQITRHLADSETVMAYRFRAVLAEENPTLTAWNEGAWAARLNYAACKPAQSLDHFRRVRADNYELLKAVSEQDWTRTGNHTERGQLSLKDLLRGAAEHAEGHARQLQAVRDAWKQAKARK